MARSRDPGPADALLRCPDLVAAMISHADRAIFVHQRKSAGTSVKALFPDAIGPDRGRFTDGVLSPDWDPDTPPVRDYFKFTVVRNPWDRFVSGWKYLKSTRHMSLIDVLENLPRERLIANVLGPGASLSARYHYAGELARSARLTAKHRLRRALGLPARAPERPGHNYRHLTRPQVATLLYPDGSLAVDRVVFVEHLAEGLAEVFAILGRAPAALPRAKARRDGDDYRPHFDAHSRALFERHFARDIATFGYDFDSGLPDPARLPPPRATTGPRHRNGSLPPV